MRILIVDDEPLVRVAFKTLVDWSSLEIDAIEEAGNGVQALELFCCNAFDVVVTDIKMPQMDGLELTGKIMSGKPQTVILILSCYGEFEMVKKAFQLGAFDYMLKTDMQTQPLEKLLRKAKQEVLERREKFQEATLQKLLLENHQDDLKEAFLKQIVWGNAYLPEISTPMIQKLHLHFHGDYSYLGVLKVTNMDAVLQMYHAEGVHLFTYGLMNIINEILSESDLGDAFCNAPNEYILLFSFCAPHVQEKEQQTIQAAMHALIKGVQNHLGIRLNVGISPFAERENQNFNQMYPQAASAFDQLFLKEEMSLLFYSADCSQPKSPVLLFDARITALKRFLIHPNQEKMQQTLAHLLLSQREAQKIEPEKIKLLYSIYISIINAYRSDHLEESENQEFFERGRQFLNQAHTLLEYNAFISEAVQAVCHRSGGNPLANQARQYIHAQFQNSISLRDAATALHVSEAHLSREFTKSEGMSFEKYLVKIRIEKACEYLENTQLTISEIACQVGYTSEEYLCRVFKKVTGYTLGSYRANNQLHKEMPKPDKPGC